MNGYVCFYNSKRIELHAKDLWDAKQKAVEQFKAPRSKQHLVSVVLAEKDGKPVVHNPASI